MTTTFLGVENNAESVLVGGLAQGATTATVADGSVFPAAGPFHVTIRYASGSGAEILYVTSVAGNTLQNLVRGQEGTADDDHNDGVPVQLRVTAQQISDIHDAIHVIETDYLLADGSRPLSDNWAPGAHNIGNFDYTAKPLGAYFGDGAHRLYLSGGNPLWQFDAGDFMYFERTGGSNNRGLMAFLINNSVIFSFDELGATIPTNKYLYFRDAALFLYSSADGQLDLAADTEIELTAPTVDIQGNITVTGTVDGVDIAARDHAQAHGAGDHTGHGNWKALYTDGVGDEQELALGADGTVLAGAGVAAAPVMEEIFITHIAEFPALTETLETGVMGGRPGTCVGESGEHGDFTAIRAKAIAGTVGAGAGATTILIEADDNPAFSSPTVLFTITLTAATEADDTVLDNAWAAGDIFIRARCTAVEATPPEDVNVFFYFKQRAENF